MPLLCHDGVRVVRHCLTDIAEVDFESEGIMEVVLEMCAISENLHHKPLRDRYNLRRR